jgi:cysteine synthase B
MELYDEYREKYPQLSLIGNTPLVRLNLFLSEYPEINIFAKVESMNPGGSIKDRPVFRMLIEALKSGKLNEDKTILDSSSGNAGIAYAMIGKILGIKVKLVMPENSSAERKKRIRAHGAEMVLTDAMDGYDEALRTCHRIYEEDPEKYFFPDQYSNDWNWKAHYETTGPEILSEMSGPITHFVSGVGTGGTITGVGRYLKERIPNLKIISVRPEDFPGIEGLKPLNNPKDIRPAILDESIIDEWIDVTSDDAYLFCQKLAENGLFVGQSSGAYLSAVYQIAIREERATIVTIFSDLGERYFSTGLWGS